MDWICLDVVVRRGERDDVDAVVEVRPEAARCHGRLEARSGAADEPNLRDVRTSEPSEERGLRLGRQVLHVVDEHGAPGRRCGQLVREPSVDGHDEGRSGSRAQVVNGSRHPFAGLTLRAADHDGRV